MDSALRRELARLTADEAGGWQEAWCIGCRQFSKRVVDVCQLTNHPSYFWRQSQDEVIDAVVRGLEDWPEICQNPGMVVVTIRGSYCPGCGAKYIWHY